MGLLTSTGLRMQSLGYRGAPGLLLELQKALFFLLLFVNLSEEGCLAFVDLLVDVLYDIQLLGIFPVMTYALSYHARIGDGVGH